MKQSRKVSEALEVQSQLAVVHTEIEWIKGRRRFLENQSALKRQKNVLFSCVVPACPGYEFIV